jgi:hypothetical protein
MVKFVDYSSKIRTYQPKVMKLTEVEDFLDVLIMNTNQAATAGISRKKNLLM